MPELGTGGNTVKQSKREGGIFLSFLPVKASSNWPNTLYIHTRHLHTGWKGQPLISGLPYCISHKALPLLTDSTLLIHEDCHLVPQAMLFTTSIDPLVCLYFWMCCYHCYWDFICATEYYCYSKSQLNWKIQIIFLKKEHVQIPLAFLLIVFNVSKH